MARASAPAPSPRARAPAAGRAAPHAPGAARRGARRSLLLGDERVALAGVADFPAKRLDLASQSIGSLEVFGTARFLPLLGELADLHWRLRDIGKLPETEDLQTAAKQTLLPSGGPFVKNREGFRRIEVVVQSVLEGGPVGRRKGWHIADERVPKRERLGVSLSEHPVRVVDRLAPVAAEEVDEQRLAPPFLQRLAQRDDVAARLRHLLDGEPQHPVVHPEPRKLVPERARLGDLVLVVGEDQVEPAAVDLERGAEVLLRHRRAVDVPARPALSPRRLPRGVLALLAPLPEREVARIRLPRGLLGLLGRVASRLLGAVAAGEPAVVREARDAE